MADNQETMTEQQIEEFMKAAEKVKQDYDTAEEGAKVGSVEEVTEEITEEERDFGEDSSVEDEAAEDIAGEAEEQSIDKKGLFGKKKDKKDKKDVQIEELTDRLKRQMAEFDNFRKRTEKEKSSMYEIGARNVIEKILPIVDNFERGLSAVAEEDKNNSFAEGMDMIYKQLMSSLEELGVKVIETIGKEFDPSLHNAVMHIEDEELGENIVAEEFQKGYTYHDSVIRHSMVKVAN